MKNSIIYQIRNIIDNKIYIGSTKDQVKRKYKHFYELKNNIHGNGHLQRAFNKYGEKNFVFEILEECEEKLRINLEQLHIDKKDVLNDNLGYNIRPRADMKKISEETKQKLSIITKNQWLNGNVSSEGCFKKGQTMTELQKIKAKRTRLLNNKKRSPISEETRKIMSEVQKGKKLSRETIQKMAISKYKKLLLYDLNNTFIKEFESLQEASKELGIHSTTISKHLIGKIKTIKKQFILKLK